MPFAHPMLGRAGMHICKARITKIWEGEAGLTKIWGGGACEWVGRPYQNMGWGCMGGQMQASTKYVGSTWEGGGRPHHNIGGRGMGGQRQA